MSICTNCNLEFENNAKFCPKCGNSTTLPKPKPSPQTNKTTTLQQSTNVNQKLIACVLAGLLVGFLATQAFSGGNNGNNDALIEELRQQINERNTQISNLENSLNELKEGSPSAERIVELLTQISSLENQLDEAKNQLGQEPAGAVKSDPELISQLNNLQLEVNTLRTDKTNLENELSSEKTKLSTLESQNSDLTTKVNSLELDIVTLENTINNMEANPAQIVALQNEIDSKQSEITQLNNRVSTLLTQQSVLEETITNLRNDIDVKDVKISEQEAKITELEGRAEKHGTIFVTQQDNTLGNNYCWYLPIHTYLDAIDSEATQTAGYWQVAFSADERVSIELKDRYGSWTNVNERLGLSQVRSGTYFIAYDPATVQDNSNDYRLWVCAINGVSFTGTVTVTFIF